MNPRMSSLVILALSLSLIFVPRKSLAVVGDVTFTGLPPNTAVSLTNEETKERVEQKTDGRGFVVIPMTGKSWQSGRHSVACQMDGKPLTSKIFLRDGVNRVDLTSLTYSARPLDPAKAQKVDEALKKSSAALKADPKNSQALLTQGAALSRLGRHSESLFSLAQAVKMGSTHPALAFETGWSLMRLGMYSEAIAQLEKYEKMRPGQGQTSEFIGRSHLFMNEPDKADAKFKEALQRDPKLSSTVRFHQAILETLRNNPQAAANHIDTLLNEAPNSPTAQIFKNALLQAPGAKPPAGAGAKDYKLSDPIKIQLPPTTAADVAGAVAKGVVGGLLGGLFGGGGRQEPEGPNLVAKPSYPETMLTSKDGKTKINLSGALENGKPNIVMGVNQSPGNGAPHLIMLQDRQCNVMQPAQVAVYEIWEVWGGWRITVSWTKSYYQDGKLVKQEKGGWSTPWNIFRTQIKDPSEIPGIWKDFGGKAFEGIRGVISSFEPPPGVPFNPADWNLVTHATTNAGNNQILTAPFVTGLGTDKDGYLTFQQRDRTVCESTPPSVPLLANMTTLPWTVGPFGIGIVGTGIPRDPNIANPINIGNRFALEAGQPKTTQRPPGGDSVVTGPGGTTKVESRRDVTRVESLLDGTLIFTFPDGTEFEERRDGTMITTRSDGTRIFIQPDGTRIERRLDGTVETRTDGVRVVTLSDGSSTTYYPDGSRVETRSDGTKISTAYGTTVETRPDRTKIVTRSDGTKITTYPNGDEREQRPDGTVIDTGRYGRFETRPDGIKLMTRRDGTKFAVFPDGSIVEVEKDGSIKFSDLPQPTQPSSPPPAEPDVPGLNDPDPPPSQQTTQGPPAVFPPGFYPDPAPDIDVPGLEDNYNAPPVDQVM